MRCVELVNVPIAVVLASEIKSRKSFALAFFIRVLPFTEVASTHNKPTAKRGLEKIDSTPQTTLRCAHASPETQLYRRVPTDR